MNSEQQTSWRRHMVFDPMNAHSQADDPILMYVMQFNADERERQKLALSDVGEEQPAIGRDRAACNLSQWKALRSQSVTSKPSPPASVPSSRLGACAHARGVLETAAEKGIRHGRQKRGPAPKLQQQTERIQHAPHAQQHFVMRVIDTLLAQQDH